MSPHNYKHYARPDLSFGSHFHLTVCLLSFLQVCEDLNNKGVRSEQVDGGGELEVLCACTVKEYVTEVVSGQLVFEMHAGEFLMNVMSQEDPQGL